MEKLKMIHNFLISRLTASSPVPLQFCLLQHKAFLFFNSFTSESQHKDDNFTISYLITSCGLSPETATRVSKHVQLKTPAKPNAVLALLKNYGFSQTQIAKFISKRPKLLLADADATLLPKLKFFHSIGVSTTELPIMVLRNDALLTRSLNKCLIPRYNLLKSVVRNDGEIVRALKLGPYCFIVSDMMNNLIPNINVLKKSGVPQSSISNLVMFHPSTVYMNHLKFVEGVKLAKELGFDALKISFVNAVHMLVHVDRAKWESRLEAYRKWGWSHETSLSAFRKYPFFVSFTVERFAKAMNFLVKDMGWRSEDIANFPVAIAYNLEKRIVPRCRIIKILKSKGLVKDDLSLASFICLIEEDFLKKYVTNFLEAVPLLLDVYQGSIDHRDLL